MKRGGYQKTRLFSYIKMHHLEQELKRKLYQTSGLIVYKFKFRIYQKLLFQFFTIIFINNYTYSIFDPMMMMAWYINSTRNLEAILISHKTSTCPLIICWGELGNAHRKYSIIQASSKQAFSFLLPHLPENQLKPTV